MTVAPRSSSDVALATVIVGVEMYVYIAAPLLRAPLMLPPSMIRRDLPSITSRVVASM